MHDGEWLRGSIFFFEGVVDPGADVSWSCGYPDVRSLDPVGCVSRSSTVRCVIYSGPIH